MNRLVYVSVLSALIMGMTVQCLSAQAYSMEIGLAPGASFYMGDANQNSLFKDTRASMNLLYRYNLNGRFSIKGLVGTSGVAGSTKGQAFNFPSGVELDFDRRLVDASVQMEWNFYEFGMPAYVPGSMTFTPYVCAGLGILGFKASDVRTSAFIPMGLGLKFKLADRYNLGCEWTFRKTYTDQLDYFSNGGGFQLTDPWLVESNGNKNKDWYSVFSLNVSMDLVGTGSKCYK